MNLIVISGREATAKSAIGRELSDRMQVPYRSKDLVKEAMFDRQKHSTWDYKWYEDNSKNEFIKDIKNLIDNNRDCIVESNFIGQDKKKLLSLLNKSVDVVEIHCVTKGFTSLKRFVARNESGRRHKGHHDRRWYPKIFFQDLLYIMGIERRFKPLNITPKTMIVDSSDFSKIDFEKLEEFIKS